MKKRLVFLVLVLVSFVVILCSCSKPNNTPTIKYKVTIIDQISKETEELEFDNNIISLSELEIKEKEDYNFIGWSIDEVNIYEDERINIEANNIIYSLWEEKINYKEIFSVGSIGRIDIYVNDPITSKKTYVTGTVSASRDDYKIEDVAAKVRLRGNSSLSAPKKSYKIKFEKKQDVFGFGSDKEWALIANYYDPSLIRNFYAYRLAQAMGVLANVDCCFVEVFLNGTYNGLYLFCETVKTGKNRIDIEVDYDDDIEDIPFLLELDYKMISDGDPDSNGVENVDFFYLDMRKVNNKNYPIATKYPDTYEDITENQFKFIRDYVRSCYDSLRTDDYEEYFDIDSVIDYFFIEELTMNVDVEHSSVFFYREQGGKLTFGPVWDFDISMGNANYVNNYKPTVLMKDAGGGNYIFNTLLLHDDFRVKFIQRMNEVSEKILPAMFDSFTENYNILFPYQKKDNDKWTYLNKSFWPKPNYLVGLTYYEQIDYVKSFLKTHLETMKEKIVE